MKIDNINCDIEDNGARAYNSVIAKLSIDGTGSDMKNVGFRFTLSGLGYTKLEAKRNLETAVNEAIKALQDQRIKDKIFET